jgi:hypothetical protein
MHPTSQHAQSNAHLRQQLAKHMVQLSRAQPWLPLTPTTYQLDHRQLNGQPVVFLSSLDA